MGDLERIWCVLPITRETAIVYAKIRHDLKSQGKPIPSNDIWLSALAVEHGCPILTKDGHFNHLPSVKTMGW